MKEFVAPVADIEKLDLVDVIATSDEGQNDCENKLPGDRG